MSESIKINASGLSNYVITVGRGLLDDVDSSLPSVTKKVLLVYPETLEASAKVLADELTTKGRLVWQFPVIDGEEAKTDRWLAVAWSSLGQAEFSRSEAMLFFAP